MTDALILNRPIGSAELVLIEAGMRASPLRARCATKKLSSSSPAGELSARRSIRTQLKKQEAPR